jgi:hypothetical protein
VNNDCGKIPSRICSFNIPIGQVLLLFISGFEIIWVFIQLGYTEAIYKGKCAPSLWFKYAVIL